jgi:serine/threonine protein kinase
MSQVSAQPLDSVNATEAAFALLFEALAERIQRGEPVDLEAAAREHPEHAERLRRLLPAVQLVAAVGSRASEGQLSFPPRDPASGEPVAEALGDFRIVRELGWGGMGVVYEAEQLSLARRVALKVLPFAATMDRRHLQRFQNEARAAASLEHPHIVPVYGVGCERGVHYYAMKLIDGQSLAEFIQQQGAGAGSRGPREGGVLDPSAVTAPLAAAPTERAPRTAAAYRRIAEWGIQAAEALEHAHGVGIVHRDVKPANLMIDGHGALWVTDFGLARTAVDNGLTMTGDVLGTLRYMSPEQALARHGLVDHRTDVYSLGVTLYELLTGQPAVGGKDRQQILNAITLEEPRPPRQVDPTIPSDLETIVLKAAAKEPHERYATAQALAEDLRRFLQDEPIRARRATLLQRARKWARRHRATVGAAAVCLLVTLLALGGSAGWVLNDRAARQREAEVKVRDAESRVEEALATAEPLLREGDPGNLALLSAAQRVEAQLGSGMVVGPEVRRRAEQLLRDVHMLADLDEIRLREADTNPETSAITDHASNEAGRFNHSGAEPRYGAAFSRYGLEVVALDPADAAARIRASAIREALLAGLDGWIHAKPPGGAGRDRLRRVADAADDSDWRRAFRAAALAEDEQQLKALAGEEEALKQPPAVLAWVGSILRWRLPAESVAILLQAQQRHPGDFWINYNLGVALRGSDPEGCIGYFRAAVALRPSSAEANSALGHSLLGARHDADAAIAALKQAVAIDRKFLLARQGLAVALKAKGRLDEALDCLSEGFELSAKDANAHQWLADSYICLGLLDEAIAYYNQAIEGDPKHRYAAACSAAAGGCGQGWLRPEVGGPRFDPTQRALLRKQALAWLRAHLEAERQGIGKPGGEAGPAIAKRVQRWLQNPNFTGVRGEEALAKLPPEERLDWQRLWEDVEALRKRGAAEPQPARSAQP